MNHDNNIINHLEMGCASAREQVYMPKQHQISIPDIKDSICDLDNVPTHLPNIACGYEFDINLQNSGHQSAQQRQKDQQDQEMMKWSQFINNYKDMQSHFQTGKIDGAYLFNKELKQEYQKIDFNLVPQLKTDQKEEMQTMSEKVGRRYQQLKQLQNQLLTDQWQDSYEQQEIRVKYKRSKDHSYVHVETEAQVCLELMVATMGSLNKFHQFMKFAQSSAELKRFSIFQRLGEIIYDLPFCQKGPKYLEKVVIDRLSHNNSVIVSYSSLTSNKNLAEKWEHYPPAENEAVIDFPVIIGKMEPLQTDKTRIGIIFKIKGHPASIADWIMDKLCKNIALGSIKKLIEKARTFGEETDTDVFEADDELYHHFNHLMKHRYKKHTD